MNPYDTYTRTPIRQINWNWHPENFKKPHTKYKLSTCTCMWSHSNIHKHENDNLLSEHFRQKLSSQNTRNGTSVHQDFKMFWGSLPPQSHSGFCLQHSRDSLLVIEKFSDFTYSKGWTVWNYQNSCWALKADRKKTKDVN